MSVYRTIGPLVLSYFGSCQKRLKRNEMLGLFLLPQSEIVVVNCMLLNIRFSKMILMFCTRGKHSITFTCFNLKDMFFHDKAYINPARFTCPG